MKKKLLVIAALVVGTLVLDSCGTIGTGISDTYRQAVGSLTGGGSNNGGGKSTGK